MIKINKDYKIKGFHKGVSKNGSAYTIIKILDQKKDAGTGEWKSIPFSVFVFNDIQIADEGTVKVNKVDAVDFKVREGGGRTFADCTIYSNDVTVTLPINDALNSVSDPFAYDDIPF